MSIRLPEGLPAARVLAGEGIEVLPSAARGAAGGGDARRPGRDPAGLRIGLLNLMPDRIRTETQFARLLGAAPRPVELVLLRPRSHQPRYTPRAHLAAFYRTWDALAGEPLDGLIVTGAPVETLPFAAVHYWAELTRIMDAARRTVAGALYVCWSAQAALRHFHGVPKHRLPAKRCGVFAHRLHEPGDPLLAGLADGLPVPVSRHTEVRAAELPRGRGLRLLADSPQAGPCLLADDRNRALYMFNHLEYDTDTLRGEYLRDRAAGRAVPLPAGYFPGDDPEAPPVNTWRAGARIFFANWVRQLARETRLGLAA